MPVGTRITFGGRSEALCPSRLAALIIVTVAGLLACGGSSGNADSGNAGTLDGSNAPLCGQPGLACCDGNACSAGGCCVTGICMSQGTTCVNLGGICNAGSCGNCGGPAQPCCGANPAAGSCTSPATVCRAGICSPCGGLGEQCCSGAAGTGVCNVASAMCSNGVCVACGSPGTGCCPGSQCANPACCYDNVCAAEGSACGASGGVCQAGRCSGCGQAGQPCCNGTCYDGFLCKSGMCAVCGTLGQMCCSAASGGAACQAGMICTTSGVCSRCGTLGNACCAGDICTEGCCSGGLCLAPGSVGCPAIQPDGGGQVDAPMAGGGGSGSGGRGGAGGVTGAGGSSGKGGAGGTTASTWTMPVGCGDGVLTAPERCDDGNTMPFDGCSSDCQPEPSCVAAGPCASKCGDGIVVGEECDDGNTASGDGCSSSCKVEAGFVCEQAEPGDSILVPAVYRDFRFHNPTDFEPGVRGATEATTGMVEALLDGDGKPVFTGVAGTAGRVASKASFASWYRDTSGVNHTTAGKLRMWKNSDGSYVNRWGANGEQWPITHVAYFCGYVGAEVRDDAGNPIPCTFKLDSGVSSTECDTYKAKGEPLLKCAAEATGTYRGTFVTKYVDGTPTFFPVDGDTFTPASELMATQIPPLYDGTSTWPYELDASGNQRMHNFSFTSEFRYWFKYDASKTYRFDVTGDDDVWVFVNKHLVTDIGGIHTPVEGPFTLDSAAAVKLGLAAGSVYEVAVFQAERQSNASTFKITLSAFNPAPSVCKAAK